MAKRKPWNWHDDRQWATSRILKNWDKKIKWFEPGIPSFTWQLEVRSDSTDAGSVRLGEIFLRGSFAGELMISIEETAK